MQSQPCSPSTFSLTASVYKIWEDEKIYSHDLSATDGTLVSCITSGTRVTMPVPRGRKSLPTRFSRTELLPDDCDPTTTICGRLSICGFQCLYHGFLVVRAKKTLGSKLLRRTAGALRRRVYVRAQNGSATYRGCTKGSMLPDRIDNFAYGYTNKNMYLCFTDCVKHILQLVDDGNERLHRQAIAIRCRRCAFPRGHLWCPNRYVTFE